MKRYLICAGFSCTTGSEFEHEFTLMADDVSGA